MPVIPLELKDTWNGYKEERDRLYKFINDKKINNIVVITGDIHMTFVADLPQNLLFYNSLFKTGSMGVEFVTPSITSSNLDEFAGFTSSFLDWLVATLNPHIKKADLSNHGYFILDVKSDKVQADWNYVNTVKEVNSEQFYSHGYYVKDGKKFLEKANSASRLVGTVFPPLVSKMETTSINEEKEPTKSVVVFGNYPNPSSEYMNLHFAVTDSTFVKIDLYNNHGELVSNLLNESLNEGIYDLSSITQDLPENIYFIQIEFEGKSVSRKIIVKH
jgi:alkaline phosphatase D